MENVAGEQDLALQQHFPYKTSKFSENSNCRINLPLTFQGAQTWPIWYFRCALSISGIL